MRRDRRRGACRAGAAISVALRQRAGRDSHGMAPAMPVALGGSWRACLRDVLASESLSAPDQTLRRGAERDRSTTWQAVAATRRQAAAAKQTRRTTSALAAAQTVGETPGAARAAE